MFWRESGVRGKDPEHRSSASFCLVQRFRTGNGWLLQEIMARLPRRSRADTLYLARGELVRAAGLSRGGRPTPRWPAREEDRPAR